MEEKRSHGLTAKSGAVILLILVLLSAMSYVSCLMPYLTHKDFAETCTSTATGTIVEAEEIIAEGNLFFGPNVEYYHAEKGRLVHTLAISAVKSKREWQPGETVTVAYDPNSPGDMFIVDDNEAVKSYKQSVIMSIVMVSVGIILLIVGIIRSVRGTDPGLYERKFIKTPDGKSFAQWADEQQKKAAEQADSTEEE